MRLSLHHAPLFSLLDVYHARWLFSCRPGLVPPGLILLGGLLTGSVFRNLFLRIIVLQAGYEAMVFNINSVEKLLNDVSNSEVGIRAWLSSTGLLSSLCAGFMEEANVGSLVLLVEDESIVVDDAVRVLLVTLYCSEFRTQQRPGV